MGYVDETKTAGVPGHRVARGTSGLCEILVDSGPFKRVLFAHALFFRPSERARQRDTRRDGIDAEDDDDDDDDEEDDDEEDDDGGEGVCSAVKLVMEEMIERGDETSDNEGNSPSRERRSRLPGTSCC